MRNILVFLLACTAFSCSEETDILTNEKFESGRFEEVEEAATEFAEAILQNGASSTTRSLGMEVGMTKQMDVPSSTRSTDDGRTFYSVSFTNGGGSVIVMKKDLTCVPIAYFLDEDSIGNVVASDDPISDRDFFINLAIEQGLEMEVSDNMSTRASQSWSIIASTGPKCKTNWHQNYPYNKYCIDKNGNTIPSGCIAVAGAQALNVLRPSIPSIISSWDDVVEYSSLYSNAISKLVYYVGTNSGLDYNNGKTGKSDLSDLVSFFKDSLSIYLCKEDKILDVLDTPHGVGIGTGYRSRHGWAHKTYHDGHAFLLDGYAEFNKMKGNKLDDDRFYLHINYGQYGYNYFKNGLYLLSSKKAWDETACSSVDPENTEYKFKVKFYPFATSNEVKSYWKQ